MNENNHQSDVFRPSSDPSFQLTSGEQARSVHVVNSWKDPFRLQSGRDSGEYRRLLGLELKDPARPTASVLPVGTLLLIFNNGVQRRT
jgi:hypothetical protein